MSQTKHIELDAVVETAVGIWKSESRSSALRYIVTQLFTGRHDNKRTKQKIRVLEQQVLTLGGQKGFRAKDQLKKFAVAIQNLR
jgi:hypothetical protein